jgi:hypothetical protein
MATLATSKFLGNDLGKLMRPEVVKQKSRLVA